MGSEGTKSEQAELSAHSGTSKLLRTSWVSTGMLLDVTCLHNLYLSESKWPLSDLSGTESAKALRVRFLSRGPMECPTGTTTGLWSSESQGSPRRLTSRSLTSSQTLLQSSQALHRLQEFKRKKMKEAVMTVPLRWRCRSSYTYHLCPSEVVNKEDKELLTPLGDMCAAQCRSPMPAALKHL